MPPYKAFNHQSDRCTEKVNHYYNEGISPYYQI